MSRWGASAKRFLTAGNGRWIALFLVVQMAVPASYYLRKDRHDERFSWRMFSTMRMAKCDPEVNVGGARVALPLHMSVPHGKGHVVAVGQHAGDLRGHGALDQADGAGTGRRG